MNKQHSYLNKYIYSISTTSLYIFYTSCHASKVSAKHKKNTTNIRALTHPSYFYLSVMAHVQFILKYSYIYISRHLMNSRDKSPVVFLYIFLNFFPHFFSQQNKMKKKNFHLTHIKIMSQIVYQNAHYFLNFLSLNSF